MDPTSKSVEKSSIHSKDPETPNENEKTETIAIVSQYDNRLTLAAIIGGWVFAAVLAIAHHAVLAHVNGKVIVEEGMQSVASQFWIKTGSTAVVRGLVLSLTASALTTLTQMEWRTSLKRAMKIGDLDLLFKLPSITSLLFLLFSSLAPFLVLTLLLVVALQGLELVTIFAPNAVKVMPTVATVQKLNISSLDLSQENLPSFDVLGEVYNQPSAYWTRIIQRVVMYPEGVKLDVPSGCPFGCTYNFTYRAPSLQCRDLEVNELTLPQSSINVVGYNATTSLANSFNISWYSPDVPYDLRVEWQSWNTTNGSTGERGGSYCLFHDAVYSISANYTGTGQVVGCTITELGDVLVGSFGGANFTCIGSTERTDACKATGNTYRATAEAFAQSIAGSILYDRFGNGVTSGGLVTITGGSPQLTPLFNLLNTNQGQLQNSWTFSPAVTNLSDSLMTMFNNVTLGLVIALDGVEVVNGTVYDGQNQWVYIPFVLWAIYGPTLLVFFLFACCGVYCVRDEGAIEASFSTFAVVTRDEGIDRVCDQLTTLNDLKEVKVRYERDGAFRLVS